MKESDFQLTVLGARGSMASDRPEQAAFGGDSSCYMLRAGEETVFLDAGTGLLNAPASYPRDPVILLSHLHLDHLIGLGMFPGISNRNQRPRIYVPFCKTQEEAESVMARVYAPPFWPLKLPDFESHPALLPLPESFAVGELTVRAIPGSHPGGCFVFRLEYHGKSVVYATDYEHEDASFERLLAFAANADLLLYDAQYDRKQYAACKGFGHSTAEMGQKLMEICKAKRLLLIHHAPSSTDEILLEREKALTSAAASYAREGQVISL